MPKDQAILDLSEPAVKRMLKRFIENAKGLHWFECRRCRDQRTLSQNAYYWAVVVKHAQAAINEAWGERLSSEQIHIMLRQQFLSRPVVDRKTGEVMANTTESTTALDTEQFADYVNEVIQWLSETFGIDVPMPGEYRDESQVGANRPVPQSGAAR